uniref:Serpin domain-containing protein n=1 Tax=Oncorhynchus tshawytscha TaxID=74940 RepID=A0A8C8GFN1_ONCTS
MTPWESCQDETSRSWEAILEESLNEFSMNLDAHLSQSQPMKNLLFSPFSISGVLTHLLLGKRGIALCLASSRQPCHENQKSNQIKSFTFDEFRMFLLTRLPGR